MIPLQDLSQYKREDRSSPESPAAVFRHWLTPLSRSPEPELDSLNRALVAGLILEVMLENPRLAEEPGSRGHRLKACLRTTLASHLAGHMSLASFHSLSQGLDHWFEVIYPVLANAGLGGSYQPAPAQRTSPPGAIPLREDLFTECLERSPGLLPHRRHRKLNPEKLRHFLESTGGSWFRLRDFEAHFQVDRKTAWEYVQKLLQAGLLVHNQGNSSAVRYQVALRFLKTACPSHSGHAGPVDSSRPLKSDWQGPLHS